jgi:hypothetical protein
MKKILLLLGMITSAVVLAWCSASATYEEIELWHDWWSTVPETTTLPAWKSYKFTITPDSNWVWCMSTIKRKWTEWGEQIIAWSPIEMVIDNAQPWEYEFVCSSMWMRQGSIIIE